ncbi:hypothetical protein D3C81_2301890 [compost metagenome]
MADTLLHSDNQQLLPDKPVLHYGLVRGNNYTVSFAYLVLRQRILHTDGALGFNLNFNA